MSDTKTAAEWASLFRGTPQKGRDEIPLIERILNQGRREGEAASKAEVERLLSALKQAAARISGMEGVEIARYYKEIIAEAEGGGG